MKEWSVVEVCVVDVCAVLVVLRECLCWCFVASCCPTAGQMKRQHCCNYGCCSASWVVIAGSHRVSDGLMWWLVLSGVVSTTGEGLAGLMTVRLHHALTAWLPHAFQEIILSAVANFFAMLTTWLCNTADLLIWTTCIMMFTKVCPSWSSQCLVLKSQGQILKIWKGAFLLY